ncbi:DUF2505 domain-containing protein [Nocardioides sp.]|uniref:DUF2505 domain-containing protein n=1 Tax=Nocardioides sp. TaxID=35761 RepID=UPI002B26B4F9|nr:DUF2505 domain-containing protein [Nocardioides sp.]
MSKTITHELSYDAPIDAVTAMLADPAFREEVCRYQRCVRYDVAIDVSGETKKVRIDQWQPTKGMPSFAKKIVGEETNVVQEETWTSPTHGDLKMSIPGKPGDMSGTASIAESGVGTVETVTLTVKVNIPLVGGKLEGLIADLLLKALKAENKVGRDYLSR